MRIFTYRLGELQTNCYLLEKDGEALIIDPADDASFLLEEMQRANIQLVGLFGTHGHFDHCMAVGEVQMSVNVPFYVHEKDHFLIKRLEHTAEHFLGYKQAIISPTLIKNITFGAFNISHFQFTVLSTPGHTPGGVSYYFPNDHMIFTGDTLFMGAVGRTDLSYSNKKDLLMSVKTILKLPEETIIYPGHGDSTYVGQEKNIVS